MAALTGLPPDFLLDLDENQWAAIEEVAADEAHQRSWSQDTEMLASILEQLQRIANRLDAGVGTVALKKASRPTKVAPIKRPTWVEAAPGSSAAQAVSPREFFQMMRERG